MNGSMRYKVVVSLVSLLTAVALSARAEEQSGSAPKKAAPASKAAVQHTNAPSARQGSVVSRGPQNAGAARGALPTRNFGGHAYRGHLAWEGGRWRHEVYNGRDGWWWDVGGVRYYYPQPMEGPPSYVSGDFIDDGPYGPPVAGAYPPPVAYAPPPPPDPGASAVGGAIVGGLLGGLLTGRASGAAAGAIAGGATGAIVGAEAASRPGYYLSQGNCYYRYPSGQYAPVDPRACY